MFVGQRADNGITTEDLATNAGDFRSIPKLLGKPLAES
jgi:hypothetical protein